MSDSAFNDITIAGVDQERTLANSVNGTIYKVHLKLMPPASSEWCQIFAETWRFPRHSMWRRAEATPQFIIIECPIHEIERHHKASLLEVVSEVNQKYREYLAKAQASEARTRAEQESARQQARSELDKIKF